MTIINNLVVYHYNQGILSIGISHNRATDIIDTPDPLNILPYSINTIRFQICNRPKVGDIFYGQIVKFQKSLNCFFVDLGNHQYALLKNNKQTLKILPHPTIGQKFLALVIKEGDSEKYPVISPQIILEGLFCNFKPFSDNITIDSFLPQEQQPNPQTVIAAVGQYRTSAGINAGIHIKTPLVSQIISEIAVLWKLWGQLNNQKYDKIGLVHSLNFLNLLYQTTNPLPHRIITNSLLIFNMIRQELNTFLPEVDIPIIYRDSDLFLNCLLRCEEDLSNEYVVDENITLHIYVTKALNFIDVDFKGLSNLTKEDALFQANVRAIDNIVRIIKLRNLSGQIFIDALKLKSQMLKKKLIQLFIETFKVYDIHANVIGFTKLGVLEIERAKKSNNIFDSLFITCPYCNGNGRIYNSHFLYLKTIIQINRIINKNPLATINIKAAEDTLNQFIIHNQDTINRFKNISFNYIIDNTLINDILVY